MKKYFPIVILLTLSLGLYSKVLGFELLRWDDLMNTTENLWVTRGAFGHFWTESHLGLYIPILYSTWSVIYQISSQAWAFHGLNWILHAVNVILVFQIIKALLPESKIWPSAIGALIFCCHPLQVETVAWVTAARDLLSTCFALAAILVYLRANRSWHWTLGAVLFAIGLLCKPTIAPLPIALFFWRKHRSLAAWFGLSAAATWITISIQSLSAHLRLEPLSLASRVLVSIDSAGFYLIKLFFPLGLAADYGRTPQVVLEDNLWLGTGIVFVGVSLLLISRRKKLARTAWNGVLLFAVMLLPVLGLIPFQAQRTSTVTDHYIYFSLIGLALFIAQILSRYEVAMKPLLAVVAIWSALSLQRLDVWQSNEIFFANMWERNPKSYAAAVSLGVISHNKADFAQAEKWLKLAHELQPLHATAVANLASVYWSQKHTSRISAEIEPLVKDTRFLDANQEETKALAVLYLLVARAETAENRWTEANANYCKFYRLDYENEAGKAEIMALLQNMKSLNLPTDSCGDP